MGKTDDRHVCYETQSSVANLCVTNSRSASMESGCSVIQLGQSGDVRIPSNSYHSKSASEDTTSYMQHDTNSSVLAKAKVVPNIVGVASGLSTSDSTVEQVTETATIRHIPQGSTSVQASRMEIIESNLSDRGFSEKVADRMARAQKSSSLRVYDGKWRMYSDWCKGRSFDPIQTTPLELADFLVYLKEERNLANSTIEGYRTSISHTVKSARDIDLGKDAQISALMSNFYRSDKKSRSSLPAWDLALVLRKLTIPFEPMHKAKLKFTTFKTVFLVALASGKRRSELHALRSDILHTKDWSSVTIMPDPDSIVHKRIRIT